MFSRAQSLSEKEELSELIIRYTEAFPAILEFFVLRLARFSFARSIPHFLGNFIKEAALFVSSVMHHSSVQSFRLYPTLESP